MRSIAGALLWASWRRTWGEVLVRIASVIFLAGGFLVIADDRWGPSLALTVAAFAALIGTSLSARWEGPGTFPMRFEYSRPVPTWLLVGVPFLYTGLICAVMFVVPLVVLRVVYSVPFPILPVGASIAAITMYLAAAAWWTSRPALRHTGTLLPWMAGVLWYATHRQEDQPAFPPDRWPDLFAFTPETYLGMALFVAVAYGLTIAGVQRQRRGEETGEPVWRAQPWARWLDRFRAECPASPGKAYLWLSIYTGALPVIAAGVTVAAATPVFTLISSITEAQGIDVAALVLLVFAAVAMPLLTALRRIVDLKRKPGVTGISVFEATMPISTGHVLATRVIVMFVSLVIAWYVAFAAINVVLLNRLPAQFEIEETREEFWEELGEVLSRTPVEFSMTVTLVLVLAMSVMAWIAAGRALLALKGKRVATWFMAAVMYLALLTVAADRGMLGDVSIVGPPLLLVHAWIIALLIAGTTLVGMRGALSSGVTPSRVAILGVLFCMLLGLGVLMVFDIPWPLIPAVPGFGLALTVAAACLPLGAFTLAPWALDCVRHR